MRLCGHMVDKIEVTEACSLQSLQLLCVNKSVIFVMRR